MGQDDEQALRDLLRLVERPYLTEGDYERLAMAVLGEMLAKDAAQQKLWRQREAKKISFYVYEDRREEIANDKRLVKCWVRLRQELYSGNPRARGGVQSAFALARRMGLLEDARWGGEAKREIEGILARQGWSPYYRPGEARPDRRNDEDDAVAAETIELPIRNDLVRSRKIAVQLGIADFWLGLSEGRRLLVVAILADVEDETARVELMEDFAVEDIALREDLRGIPEVPRGLVREMPDEILDVLDQLPERSAAVLIARYFAFSPRNLRLLHNAISDEVFETRGEPDLLEVRRLVMNHLVNRHEADGAALRFEIELELEEIGFSTYLWKTEQLLPKIERRETKMRRRHAEESDAEHMARLAARARDPGLRHINERYQRLWEISQRSGWERLGAAAEGFGCAAWGTVTGLWDLITTDPRETAAGLYHLATHPEILVDALDEALVDPERLAGGAIFEIASSMIGGPASKVPAAKRAASLAEAAEDAAKAGKLRAAARLADAAEEVVQQAGQKAPDIEDAIARARKAIGHADDAVAAYADAPDELLKRLKDLPPGKPYSGIDKLKRSLAHRGVEVAWGDRGTKLLEAIGAPDSALGAFVVLPPQTPGGPPITGLIFRGDPTAAVVHHELWHRADFIKNHGGDYDRWAKGTRLAKEQFVHDKLTTGARGKTRWGTYSTKEKLDQALYIEDIKAKDKLAEVMKQLEDMGLRFDTMEDVGRAGKVGRIAAWVHPKARSVLQRAVDKGPNHWAALENRPSGARFQRGLSGDYGSGIGGLDEAKRLLSGQPDPVPRTVSRIGEQTPPGKTTFEVTASYSDPLSIRGRSDRIDPTRGRNPDREALIERLSLDDVEAIGFFPSASSPYSWARSYQRLLEQAGAVPTPGSRGARFMADLEGVLGRARWGENHIGRYVTNMDELEAALRDLYGRYGSR